VARAMSDELLRRTDAMSSTRGGRDSCPGRPMARREWRRRIDRPAHASRDGRDGAIGGGCRERAAPGRRAGPLGAQRRSVREREDVLSGDRNVRVVRKPGVTSRNGVRVAEGCARGKDRDGAGGAALPEAGALRPVMRRRFRARRQVMVGDSAMVGMLGRRCSRRMSTMHGASVCQLRSRRGSDEPDPYEQGYDTSPHRAPHEQQLMRAAHSCHAPWSQHGR
jgi:hypothetical protein